MASEIVAEHNHEARRSRGFLGAVRELALILVVALLLSFLVKTFVFRTFFIPSESMEPTLQVSDQVAVGILGFSPEQLSRGDVVVFRDDHQWLPQLPSQPHTPLTSALQFVGLAPENADQYLVKRVIGLPGDTVSCDGDGGPVLINGQPVEEPYLEAGVLPSTMAFEVTVPEHELWVMGDNRTNSADSRFHRAENGGFIDDSSVVGRAQVIFWPIARWGAPS